MKAEGRTISELFADDAIMNHAMNAAVRDAVLQHKQRGLPLAVWRDGKVAWVSADESDINSGSSTAPASTAKSKAIESYGVDVSSNIYDGSQNVKGK